MKVNVITVYYLCFPMSNIYRAQSPTFKLNINNAKDIIMMPEYNVNIMSKHRIWRVKESKGKEKTINIFILASKVESQILLINVGKKHENYEHKGQSSMFSMEFL